MRSRFKQEAKNKQKLFEDKYILNRLEVFNFINKQTPIIQVEDLEDYYLVYYLNGNPNGVKLKKDSLSPEQMNEIYQYMRYFVIKLTHE